MERARPERSGTATHVLVRGDVGAHRSAGRRAAAVPSRSVRAAPDARLRSAFLSLADSIARSADLMGLLRAVLDTCADLVGADDGVAALVDEEQRLHVVARTVGTVVPDRRPDRLLHAVPMRVGPDVLGRVALFGGGAATSGRPDRDALQAFVDVATPKLLEHRLAVGGPSMPDPVARALEARMLIARAEGVLMARWDLSAGDARRALHHLAGRCGRSVPDLARRILDSAEPPAHGR